MKLYPGDAIRSSGNGIPGVELSYYGNKSYLPVLGIAIGEGQVVLMAPGSEPNSPLKFALNSDPANPSAGEIVYFRRPMSLSEMDLIMQAAIIRDTDTEFEVIGNSTRVTVYVFNGSVQLSNPAGTSTVTVGANQTATMATGGLVAGPTAFDPTTVDHWWTAAMTSSSDTSINWLSEFLSGYKFYIVAIVIVAVVTLGLIATRRRGGGGQAAPSGRSITQTVNVLPPPPPKAEAKTTKYCQTCGVANAASAEFCRSCGRRFSR
jgi:hypothetical protein